MDIRLYDWDSCRQEWRVVLERDASFATAHRRIPDCRELLATERARRAGLKECEVVAIVLYTGPMVCPPTLFIADPTHISLRCRALSASLFLSQPHTLPGRLMCVLPAATMRA